MFNLPNNTPYFIIIESDNGYMIMTQRWRTTPAAEMGPVNTFETYTKALDVLASAEKFMAERNETD